MAIVVLALALAPMADEVRAEVGQLSPRLVKDIYTEWEVGDSCGGLQLGPIEAGGLLYFVRDGQPWRSDGTAAGTLLLRQLSHRPEAPGYFVAWAEVDGRLYFVWPSEPLPGVTIAWRDLWVSDGTSEGTKLVRRMGRAPANEVGTKMVAVGGRVVISGQVDGQLGMWASDGTPGNLSLLRQGVTWHDALVSSGKSYFTATTPNEGRELWRTDGTASGTALIRDIRPGSEGSWPGLLTPFGSGVLFMANNGVNGIELWAVTLVEPEVSALDELAHQPSLGTATVSVTAALSHAAASDVTVSYCTEDGTALAGRDFQPQCGAVVVPKGERSAAIPLIVYASADAEQRFLFVRITSAVGAAVRRAVARITLSELPVTSHRARRTSRASR